MRKMISFAYTLLAGMCGAALEAVGLDPYVGFFHRDRPGRMSLALDLMEELRPIMADRFVITLINKRMIGPEGFIKKEDGAVIMEEETRKQFLASWQTKKAEAIRHPFLDEKIEWGMVPYVQALLEEIIDKDRDSLRFYYLGDNYKNKVEHIGAKPGYDVTDPLIF